MIKAECKVVNHEKKLKSAVRKGSAAAIYRAAAGVRTTARRLIRKRKGPSRPGQPPHDHSNFKNSIMFDVEKSGEVAFIGPRRTSGKLSLTGKPVPNVLEFSGVTAPSRNAAWIRKKGVSLAMTSKESVTAYFTAAGFGPVFAGESSSQVVAAATRGKRGRAAGKIRSMIRSKYSAFLGKKVFFVDLKIRSPKMAKRAADNAVRYFGFPSVPAAKVEARPFMGPSLDRSRSFIAKCFKNTVKP